MPAGRPFGTFKFKSVKELQEQIDAYFDACVEQKRPLTMSGLAYALGVSRVTLLNYKRTKGYEKYFSTIKRAKARVEDSVEEILLNGRAPAGAIFNLKNNFDWEDKRTVDGEQTLKIIESLADEDRKALNKLLKEQINGELAD